MKLSIITPVCNDPRLRLLMRPITSFRIGNCACAWVRRDTARWELSFTAEKVAAQHMRLYRELVGQQRSLG